MFHKDFQFPLEITRPEYKVLEEFLDEGEPIVNPYEIALMYQMQEESQQGLEIDPYFPQSKTQNTHKMAEWSVIGTQMHYVQHPHVQEGLLLNQCEQKIDSQIMGKMESPNLLSLEGESKQIKDVFTDRFDCVVHFLHATEKFIDSRDIPTTYLGVDSLSLRDYHVAECSFPIYSNSHTWG